MGDEIREEQRKWAKKAKKATKNQGETRPKKRNKIETVQTSIHVEEKNPQEKVNDTNVIKTTIPVIKSIFEESLERIETGRYRIESQLSDKRQPFELRFKKEFEDYNPRPFARSRYYNQEFNQYRDTAFLLRY